MKQKEAAIKS